ncbi:MAG TPA: glucose 1-dehydrogenase [Acidimicrobiales bacterium]|nr:glucose 1-dehydrogenase [Acidimicrobiales bacterium]
MTARLDGKVALVTGAARGQGEAHVRRFVAEGAKVVATDVLIAEGEALAAELGADVVFEHHDVADEAQWAAVVKRAEETFGGIDVLVNNAGIARMAPLVDMSTDDYLDVIKVNQVGVFFGMRAVAPVMQRRGGGSIVNISSIDGMAGMANVIGYVASKFAVRGMTKTAAVELGPLGIRVNSVHPGGVDTPMIRPPGFEEVDYDAMFARLPIPRCGTPEDIASLVLFLASEESSYITGTEHVIDGGLLAGVSLFGV